MGNFSIRLASTDADFLFQLSKLFLPATANTDGFFLDLDRPIDSQGSLGQLASEDPSSMLSWLLRQIYLSFEDHLWIDASALSFRNSGILIAGPSHAGKTTLVLSACIGGKFKILSEDITFIGKPNLLRCLTVPLSLRLGTVERIESATGATLPCPAYGEWIFMKDLYETRDSVPLRTAVVMEPIDPHHQAPLQVAALSIDECLTRLLPISNALRLSTGVEHLNSIVSSCEKFSLRGGTVRDRIDWLSERVS